MKVITSDAIKGTERDVQGVGFTSLRYLLESDGMGFSLHRTHIPAGGPHHWHYKNHLEACYCVSGKGIILNRETGESHSVLPGTTYVLDNHDDHEFTAIENTVLISIFNPPCKGQEVHNEDGSYG